MHYFSSHFNYRCTALFPLINKNLKNLNFYQVDTGRKLNVYKTFRRRTGRLLNVLWTFNLRPVSTGKILIKSGVSSLVLGEISLSILKDENLQGRKKPIFSIYSLMKLLEDNVPYCKLNLWNLLTDSKVQRGI